MSTQTKEKTVNDWYRQHDYDAVLERLSKVRKVTLTGDLEQAGENLRRAYHFAVLSIKTAKDIHEHAFELWMDGEHLMTAIEEAGVNFKNNKVAWIKETDHGTDWQLLALAVRAHVKNERWVELMNMCDHLKGVHYSKWGFTLAMAGVWEVICIDSNVKKHFEMEGRFDLRGEDGYERYSGMVKTVTDEVDAALPPFLAQWIIYDMTRGEHATHMPYFRAAYPFCAD